MKFDQNYYEVNLLENGWLNATAPQGEELFIKKFNDIVIVIDNFSDDNVSAVKIENFNSFVVREEPYELYENEVDIHDHLTYQQLSEVKNFERSLHGEEE